MRRDPGLFLAVLVATAPSLSGCPRPCEGVGCESDFSASLVGLQLGADQPQTGEISPLDARLLIEGDASLGPSWDLALAPGLVLVGSPVEGAVRGFALGDGGLVDAGAADMVIAGESAFDAFGSSVDVVPDFDGDGLDELIVGAPRLSPSTASREDGAVYLMSGLGSQLDPTARAKDALLTVISSEDGVHLGEVVAGCQDLDGDGLGDWVATAPWDSRDAELSGAVHLGLSSRWDGDPLVQTGDLDLVITSRVVGAGVGAALSCQHDVLGDAHTDLLVGAPFMDGDHEAEGAVYVISGGPGLDSQVLEEATQLLVLPGLTAESWLGWSLATGDLDGDGLADVVAGAPGADGAAGQVHIWLGRFLRQGTELTPRFRVFGTSPGDSLGRTVAITDLDGDGLGDLIMGAPRRNPLGSADSAFDAGTLYVFKGSLGLVSWRPQMDAADADLTYVEAQQFLRTGKQVVVGDVDGDGLGDMALLHRIDSTSP